MQHHLPPKASSTRCSSTPLWTDIHNTKRSATLATTAMPRCTINDATTYIRRANQCRLLLGSATYSFSPSIATTPSVGWADGSTGCDDTPPSTSMHYNTSNKPPMSPMLVYLILAIFLVLIVVRLVHEM
jgi:hypothetical protein